MAIDTSSRSETLVIRAILNQPIAAALAKEKFNYRPDIDGLRAVAVLAVVFFHAFPNLLTGGFIGVDIFFVISGFLISGMIFSGLQSNTFNFLDFYCRRIKRIFPALLLVMSACLLFGWFTLLNDEYKQLGKHIRGGAGFISNFLLWNESGYFDSAAVTKPLLHLWSLGIEEQFYIVWPLLLYIAWKHNWNVLLFILLMVISSFALNISQTDSDKIAAFYSPQTRFWELLLGAALAYATVFKPHWFANSNPRIANYQSILSLAVVITSLFILSKQSAFPGWWALIPVLATVLIIAAGPQAWLNRNVLSHRLLVGIGLISFPLYLWHWPLFSFYRIIHGEKAADSVRVLLILTALLLAWLSYRLIETPIRKGGYAIRKSLLLLLGMMILGGLAYGYIEHGSFAGKRVGAIEDKSEFVNYFENSLPEQKYFHKMGLSEKFRDDCNFYDMEKYRAGAATTIPRPAIAESCYIRDWRYSRSVFIWGDSHAQHLNYGLSNYLPKKWQILQVASSGCLPNSEVEKASASDYCQQSNWFALQAIAKARPNVVIVAQNPPQSVENLDKITARLKAWGVRKIIFMGETPHWQTDLPKLVLRKMWENTPQRSKLGLDQDVLAKNAQLQEEFHPPKSVHFVNLIDFFCNSEGCLIYLNDKKTGITSFDYGHLTPVASLYLAENLLGKIVVD